LKRFYLILFLFLLGIQFVGFSQSESYKICEIIIEGNHKTKSIIIIREANFKVNDSISLQRLKVDLEKLNQNLLKTSLFNFVNTDFSIDGKCVKVKISVEERWYYWAYPILENADRNLSSFFYYKDYSRINYGLAFDWYNFRGMGEMLKFKFRFGFKEQYSIAYSIPGIGQNRTSGFWTSFDYFRQKRVIGNIQNNKPVFVENADNYIWRNLKLEIGYSLRPQINYKFKTRLIYNSVNYRSYPIDVQNIVVLFDKRIDYINPEIKFEFDNRNSNVYPTRGTLISADCGLNSSFSDLQQTYFSLNSNMQFNTNIIDDFMFYRGDLKINQIFNSNKVNIPFYRKLDFSSNFIIRGFEYYYLISPFFCGLQQTLSFKISDFKIHNISKRLPDEFAKTYTKIYLNCFADMAYTSSFVDLAANSNPMNEKLLYSYGMGICLETYYDRLFEIRAAYNGYFGKIAIFVDYKTPINKFF
jgi:outer membrane protein assembly factor BamA